MAGEKPVQLQDVLGVMPGAMDLHRGLIFPSAAV